MEASSITEYSIARHQTIVQCDSDNLMGYIEE